MNITRLTTSYHVRGKIRHIPSSKLEGAFLANNLAILVYWYPRYNMSQTKAREEDRIEEHCEPRVRLKLAAKSMRADNLYWWIIGKLREDTSSLYRRRRVTRIKMIFIIWILAQSTCFPNTQSHRLIHNRLVFLVIILFMTLVGNSGVQDGIPSKIQSDTLPQEFSFYHQCECKADTNRALKEAYGNMVYPLQNPLWGSEKQISHNFSCIDLCCICL